MTTCMIIKAAVCVVELVAATMDTRAASLTSSQIQQMQLPTRHGGLQSDLPSHVVPLARAAQIMEVETFIPMVLQDPDAATGRSRLKRIVLIGDHHQLPPVVKNAAFQKYARLDQSLFARFVRLGVPATQLDQQGRARSSMADLYRWRYDSLGDLPEVRCVPSRATYQLSAWLEEREATVYPGMSGYRKPRPEAPGMKMPVRLPEQLRGAPPP